MIRRYLYQPRRGDVAHNFSKIQRIWWKYCGVYAKHDLLASRRLHLRVNTRQYPGTFISVAQEILRMATSKGATNSMTEHDGMINHPIGVALFS